MGNRTNLPKEQQTPENMKALYTSMGFKEESINHVLQRNVTFEKGLTILCRLDEDSTPGDVPAIPNGDPSTQPQHDSPTLKEPAQKVQSKSQAPAHPQPAKQQEAAIPPPPSIPKPAQKEPQQIGKTPLFGQQSLSALPNRISSGLYGSGTSPFAVVSNLPQNVPRPPLIISAPSTQPPVLASQEEQKGSENLEENDSDQSNKSSDESNELEPAEAQQLSTAFNSIFQGPASSPFLNK